MNTVTTLPDGFEALEPFVETWSIVGAANRADQRMNSREEERAAFFNVAHEMVGPALELLDNKPLDQFDEREKRLMNLMLSLAYVALAVEIQGDDEAKHARNAQHITITRASSDYTV